MSSKTQIPLKKFTDEFELENLTHDIDIEGRMLKQKFVNRPALQLTGFFDHFDNTRYTDYRTNRAYLYEEPVKGNKNRNTG